MSEDNSGIMALIITVSLALAFALGSCNGAAQKEKYVCQTHQVTCESTFTLEITPDAGK